LHPRHRRILYTISLILFLSGAGWAWIHWLDDAGKAGAILRKINPWLLAIHGGAALGFAILLGTLLPVHVRHSWHARKNRKNGAMFLGAVSMLTTSGYALYYLGNESWRSAASQFHLVLGLAAPALLIWHIWSGRKATEGPSQPKPEGTGFGVSSGR
jgi:hypothetical protein